MSGINEKLVIYTDPVTGEKVYGKVGEISVTLDNVSQLAAFSVEGILENANPFILVKGYATPGDGGGGIFYIDTGDESTPTDHGTVFVEPGGKRYKRVMEERGVNVRWFGIGLGSSFTDDTRFKDLIQNHSVIKIPSNTTVRLGAVNNNVVMTTGKHSIIGEDHTSRIEFNGSGATGSNKYYPLWMRVSEKLSTTLSGAVTKGGKVITVSSASGVAVGDLVEIIGTNPSNKGELSVVTKVNGTSITLKDHLFRSYTTAAVKFYPYYSVEIRNVAIHTKVMPVFPNNIYGMLMLWYAQNSVIQNVRVTRDSSLGEFEGTISIDLEGCYESVVRECFAENMNSTYGYGVGFINCRRCMIENNYITNCKGSIDIGSDYDGSIDNVVQGNVVNSIYNEDAPGGSSDNASRGLRQHTGGMRTKFIGNTVTGCTNGILDSGDLSLYENNKFINCRYYDFGAGTEKISRCNYYDMSVREDTGATMSTSALSFLSDGDTYFYDSGANVNRKAFLVQQGLTYNSLLFRNAYVVLKNSNSGIYFTFFGGNALSGGNFALKNFMFDAMIEDRGFVSKDFRLRDSMLIRGSENTTITFKPMGVYPAIVNDKQRFVISRGNPLTTWGLDKVLKVKFRYNRKVLFEDIAEWDTIIAWVSGVYLYGAVGMDAKRSVSFADVVHFGIANNAIAYSESTQLSHYAYNSASGVSMGAEGSNNEFYFMILPPDSSSYSWNNWTIMIEMLTTTHITFLGSEFIDLPE